MARTGCDATPEQVLLQERERGRGNIVNAGENSPRARERAHLTVRMGRKEPLYEKQQPPPRPGLAAQDTGSDTFRSKQNVTVVHAPEEEPPDAENTEEDSRNP